MSLALRGVESFAPISSFLQHAASQRFAASTALSTLRAYRSGEHVSPIASPLSTIPKTRAVFQRGMATKIDSPLKGEAFFNRKKEIEALMSILNGEPELSLVSGPVDSGKSALMLHVLQKLAAVNNRPVLYLDLRERSFSSVNTFHDALEDEMDDWLKNFKSFASQFNLKDASVKNNQIDPLSKLNSLFKIMSDQLARPWWAGAQSPILFIDEANEMNMLLKDPQGREALANLFKWFVAHTKEKRHFHVVLAASDSFYHLRVERLIGSSRCTSIVIGNLTKQEAKQFWMSRAAAPLKLPEEHASALFEDAYQVCGGNMYFLNRYAADYALSKGQLRPTGFFLVRNETAKLVNALFRNISGPASAHTENGKAVWTEEQFITMMKMLTESETGFLDYRDLCRTLGQKAVDGFISYHSLHLRPSKNFAYDLPEAPDNRAIVTAETPAGLFAMRLMLKDLKDL